MSSRIRLSRARTVLLWGLAIVWFSEMALWDLRPLSEVWTRFWVLVAPPDPQLTTVLHLTHATEGAVKGAFGALAVFALRSGVPFVRTALFVPMAFVPPLNLLFQFRAQGFPIRPTLIGATLTVILWQTFFLFRDGDPQPPRRPEEPPARLRMTAADLATIAWLGVNAAVLSAAAMLFLVTPDTGLRLAFGCLTSGVGATAPMPPGLTWSAMAVGTHLTALSIAAWIGVFTVHRSPIVRRAVASASTVHAALLCLVPLRQLVPMGGGCATSSLLAWSAPLLAGWLLYAALSYRTSLAARPLDAAPATR